MMEKSASGSVRLLQRWRVKVRKERPRRSSSCLQPLGVKRSRGTLFPLLGFEISQGDWPTQSRQAMVESEGAQRWSGRRDGGRRIRMKSDAAASSVCETTGARGNRSLLCSRPWGPLALGFWLHSGLARCRGAPCSKLQPRQGIAPCRTAVLLPTLCISITASENTVVKQPQSSVIPQLL